MSKRANTKKKVVTTTSTRSKRVIKPTTSKKSVASSIQLPEEELLFDKQNYILMGVSILVIAIGFMLMSGGGMPSPDVWDESIIYSFRRITLAPFVVLVGLVIMIVAIFKK